LGTPCCKAGNGLEAIAMADGHTGKIDSRRHRQLVTWHFVVMPRMGGPELIAKLREKRDHFTVIFMTGYTELGVLETTKIGSDTIIFNKPFSTDALARKISEAKAGPFVEQALSAGNSG